MNFFKHKILQKIGLKTCLVIHSQDCTTEHLLDCKIGTNIVSFEDNLSVARLETTKVCCFQPYSSFPY